MSPFSLTLSLFYDILLSILNVERSVLKIMRALAKRKLLQAGALSILIMLCIITPILLFVFRNKFPFTSSTALNCFCIIVVALLLLCIIILKLFPIAKKLVLQAFALWEGAFLSDRQMKVLFLSKEEEEILLQAKEIFSNYQQQR